MQAVKYLVENISKLKNDLYLKDFLLTSEKSIDDLEIVLNVAEALKKLRENNISTRIFDSGIGVSQFRDNSTRTRFSFAKACDLLGLFVQDLDEGKSQIAHGETVRETANMISFLSEVIGIRDDMYLGAGNAYMRNVANALEAGFSEGVLPQRPAVVNLQCDIDHPTQSMSDLLHLKNYFGDLEKLKGKKIAMTWAYSPSYGKPLSVPQGIIGLLTRFGMDVTLAHPEEYCLIDQCVETAQQNANISGGKFSITNSMDEAFKDADIVYPKSWASFNVMKKRTELLRTKDDNGLIELERACLAQNSRHKDWECTEEKMKLTKDGNALYMHCLPADISGVSCEEGEVSEKVFEKYRIETYKEAGYKPYIIASMILTSRIKNPDDLLNKIIKRNQQRIFF